MPVFRVKIEKNRTFHIFPTRFRENWKMKRRSVFWRSLWFFRANFGRKFLVSENIREDIGENRVFLTWHNWGPVFRVKIEKNRTFQNFPSRFRENWKMKRRSVFWRSLWFFRANFGTKFLVSENIREDIGENRVFLTWHNWGPVFRVKIEKNRTFQNFPGRFRESWKMKCRSVFLRKLWFFWAN